MCSVNLLNSATIIKEKATKAALKLATDNSKIFRE
jgi:hypothetical protein